MRRIRLVDFSLFSVIWLLFSVKSSYVVSQCVRVWERRHYSQSPVSSAPSPWGSCQALASRGTRGQEDSVQFPPDVPPFRRTYWDLEGFRDCHFGFKNCKMNTGKAFSSFLHHQLARETAKAIARPIIALLGMTLSHCSFSQLPKHLLEAFSEQFYVKEAEG